MKAQRSHSTQRILEQCLFPAKSKQRERLIERRDAETRQVCIDGLEFDVLPKVYQTSVDTLLLCRVVKVNRKQRLLEVGCGCGAASIILASKAKCVEGVDINPSAVLNSDHNAQKLGVKNSRFYTSDVFEKVEGSFDVIVCNPPYNNADSVSAPYERMFWDPDNEMKKSFFANVRRHLSEQGRVYFGWANFADLEPSLPLKLAESAGLQYIRHYSAPAGSGAQCFHVIEFVVA